MSRRVVVIALALAALVSLSVAASPGTSDDPLVSKSYVDDKINQVMALLSGTTLPSTSPGVTMPESASYVPVSATTGQMLLGGEGTEIILRSGRAMGYCGGENGIVDITTGDEIFNGMEVSKNHLLIVPREDGRGVVILEDAWFIVKGSYTIW